MLAAIDIGGTKTRLAVAKSPGEVLQDKVIPTPHNQSLAPKTMLEVLLDLSFGQKILSLGIASPGPIDTEKGIIIKPRHIPWNNLAISKYFKHQLGCLTTLGHDATLAGIAEAKLGAGKNHSLVLYVTISTGIGTAIILNGQSITQRFNSEGGMQIVNNKPFPGTQYQKIASGSAIKNRYGKIAAEIQNKKDWNDIAQNISTGLFNLITIIQPDIVVLGGGVSVHYNHFITPLRTYLDNFHSLYPIPPIKQAKFVETAPIVGALLQAKSELTVG